MSQNRVRITGGNLRGSYVNFLEKSKIKPTKSYIREVVFNMIPINNNTKCLDLFAGSGILSFEAMSRGAAFCLMIEKNKAICKKLESEIKRLKVGVKKNPGPYCDVKEYDVENLFDSLPWYSNSSGINPLGQERLKNEYDVIFVDPPYDSNLLIETIKEITIYTFKANRYIFLEQSKKNYNPDVIEILKNTYNQSGNTYDILKNSSIGDVCYTIAKKRE